jgi:glutathione peroxidase
VLGFPCNQFGAQEPGTNEEVLAFAKSKYNVNFPMFAKLEVNGDDAATL